MTDSDRTAFARAVYAMGETFNEPVSELRVEGYFDALADLELPDVLTAIRSAIRESRFFPRPVELRELVQGSLDDQAEIAWSSVRRMVQRFGFYTEPKPEQWPDEATRRAAMELYGGWKALCSSLPADGAELLGYRKTFIASYRAYAHGETRDPLRLPESFPIGYLSGEDE